MKHIQNHPPHYHNLRKAGRVGGGLECGERRLWRDRAAAVATKTYPRHDDLSSGGAKGGVSRPSGFFDGDRANGKTRGGGGTRKPGWVVTIQKSGFCRRSSWVPVPRVDPAESGFAQE